MRALGLPPRRRGVRGDEEIALRVTSARRRRRRGWVPDNPCRPPRVEFGLLAVRPVVVAVPDPRAEHLDPVARLWERPERVEARLALGVDRPALRGLVARRAGEKVVRRIDRDVDVQVVRDVRQRVVRARDARGEQPARTLDDTGEGAKRRRRPVRREIAVVDVDPVRGQPREELRPVALAAVGERLHVRVGLDVREPPGRRGEGERNESGDGERATHVRIITGVPATASAKTRRSVPFGSRMHPFETA